MYHVAMRAVTPMDANEIARLEAELFESHMGVEAIQAEICAGFGWLIEDEEALQSYILVRDDKYILDITRLGTRTEYQGRGNGTQLLSHVLRTLRPAMLCVDFNNTVGLRMYLKHGFQVAGRIEHDENWVMRR